MITKGPKSWISKLYNTQVVRRAGKYRGYNSTTPKQDNTGSIWPFKNLGISGLMGT
jgi:hypothetical protein